MLMQSQATMQMSFSSFADVDSTKAVTPFVSYDDQASKPFVLSVQEIINLIDNVILAKEKGLTRKQIISQIDLLLDKESLEAVSEARREYKRGKLRSYQKVDELLRDLNAG